MSLACIKIKGSYYTGVRRFMHRINDAAEVNEEK
jgi:hypothetical protein